MNILEGVAGGYCAPYSGKVRINHGKSKTLFFPTNLFDEL